LVALVVGRASILVGCVILLACDTKRGGCVP
jgi:hypothetical protein